MMKTTRIRRALLPILAMSASLMAVQAAAQVTDPDAKGRVALPTGSTVSGDDKGPVTLPTANTAIVPNVVGMVYGNAIPVIQGAGFYARSNQPLSVSRSKVVVSQSPPAGTRAQRNTFVTANVP